MGWRLLVFKLLSSLNARCCTRSAVTKRSQNVKYTAWVRSTASAFCEGKIPRDAGSVDGARRYRQGSRDTTLVHAPVQQTDSAVAFFLSPFHKMEQQILGISRLQVGGKPVLSPRRIALTLPAVWLVLIRSTWHGVRSASIRQQYVVPV